ncbi:protein FdhD [Oxobacter pfennigii]|uniref:Sulfur carrier protein FdhD n=1 Tax=Oxobacter pfennigii TaxID=36849 RepID=A0A0P9AFD7_9CLOT|nr:formate dehydrogenase accessory sulfurtransferase FdhD [Oxobacter pfennigii]KPU44074.1 protein FdhD [Oxobacter pfennigii]
MKGYKELDIEKYDISGERNNVSDFIVEESPLNIFVNNMYYITLMCTPVEVEELCIGYLFSEAIIESQDDIENIEISTEDIVFIKLKKDIVLREDATRVLVSGCGKGMAGANIITQKDLLEVDSTEKFEAEFFLKHMKEFSSMSGLFKLTGCAHSSCVCGENGNELLSDDIGRHNAIDKTIGKCILNNVDVKKRMLFTSGRVSSDSVIKAIKAGFPILASHSAPTSLAVEIAARLNLTLIGFVRGKRMNIYSHPERII